MRKNVYLLTPNLPTSSNSHAILQTSTMLGNNSDDEHQQNQNYQLDNQNSATSDNINHNLVMIGDNDENYFELFRTPMRFGTENHTTITTQIGATAHIPCTIHHIGEGVVSAFLGNFQFTCLHSQIPVFASRVLYNMIYFLYFTFSILVL